MGRYVLRRVLLSIPLLLGISLASFLILRAVPGGPLSAYENNPGVTAADLSRLEHELGLDRPLHEQYLAWLSRFVSGDWGYSYSTHLAVPIGVLTAVRQYSLFDHVVTGLTFAGLSMPTFWLGLLLIIVFGLTLGVLPLGGMGTPGAPLDLGDRLRHLVLPVATLSF